ncbi:sigma-70 family RNA polymerase sigma factor [Mogibacterium sp. NSJ-24]|jgi:RNA polymerase sporulation-specific sigma factor|uniref:RNA polymerase sigma factor SigS n=1 Tax=Lentihominibacter hominis TaxID=2763645 RepID=A0A926E8C5_9FIRM|nr:sigma-70 family RNA polymerase sigma factor [Lentihominibacter hominis]MBC8568283.1 sigma-70 family RNA polymerase sigma factor [Lentihominibacter hominis]
MCKIDCNSCILSDSDLAVMAQGGDLDAEERLMRRYKETVRIKSKMYYMAGADEDDVVQEGMIGLLKAIRQFDAGKAASFETFANICITRQIISAIRSAARDKHRALNTSVPLSNPLKPENEDLTIADTLKTNMEEDPEELLVLKDIAYYIRNNGDNVFSDFEMQVLSEVLKDNDYRKISAKLGKSIKSIDNAMQRVKKKIVNYLWN